MPQWRTLLSPPATGAENMATDEALMDRARRAGEWVLRVYAWQSPTLSLGRNQIAAGCYDLDRIRELGIEIVRRPTGGRAILHDREITYSVTAPLDEAGDLTAAYGRINGVLLHALSALGVGASEARAPSVPMRPGLAPCFDHPSFGELVVAGRKLVGSAQWRADGALLQHGSILVDDDQQTLAALSVHPVAAPPPPATLRECLGRAPEPREMADALADALRKVEGAEAAPLERELDMEQAVSTAVARYTDDAWTWRR